MSKEPSPMTIEEKTEYIKKKLQEKFKCPVTVCLGMEKKYVAHILNVPKGQEKEISHFVHSMENVITEKEGYLVLVVCDQDNTKRYYPGFSSTPMTTASLNKFPSSLEIANAVTIPVDPIMGANNL